MPWRECYAMDERLRFVARLLEGEKMAPLCADFGISRKIGYKNFERYQGCRGGHGPEPAAVSPSQSERSFRSLYYRSDGVSGRGASVQCLSHSAPLMVASIVPRAHRGTKHLAA